MIYIKCKFGYVNHLLIKYLFGILYISGTTLSAKKMSKQQGASNLVYYTPFNIFYYLWSERSNSLTRHTIHILFTSFTSEHSEIPLYITHIHCAFSFTIVFLFIVYPIWNTLTCTHQLRLNSNDTHTMKSFLIPKLGASMVRPIIFCEYPNHNTSHHLFICLPPSLDWKLLRGRDSVLYFFSQSLCS